MSERAVSGDRFGEVLGSYLEALEAGEAPELAELLEGHPELAGELAAFFAQQEQFEQMVAPLRAAAEAARGEEPTEPDPEATMPPRPSGRTRPEEGMPSNPGETVSAPPPPDRGSDDGDRGDDGGGDAGEPLPRGARVRYFGDYELRGVLGQGGKGVVYKARQLSLNRPVALKMIRAGSWADEDEVRRFRNEAEAIANLDHPRIVTIHEVGRYQGRHYFSMKLVEGPSLDRRLGDYAAQPCTAARLVAEIARAVHHAHQRGILHRDLKPSNILLDPEGHPHVTDFGLAKRIGGDGALSLSGSVVGTPQYMSPEQADGQRSTITTATDVYGLGAILYAALTGQPPLRGDSVVETLDWVRQRMPAAPSKLNRRVPRDLEVICLKCLEKDPKRRYDSAAAVAEDLGRYLADEPILARRTGIPVRVLKWARRRPAIAALVALVHLVAAAGLVGVLWQWRKAERARAAEARANADLSHANRNLSATNEMMRQNLYFERTALAQSELLAHNVGRAEELLAGCPEDLRGWEWHSLKRLRYQDPLALRGHVGIISDLAFSPDGRRLASTTTGESDVTIWDTTTAQDVLTLRHTMPVGGVTFSPDGRQIASAGYDMTVRLWDAATGRETRILHGHTHSVCGVAFTPDGRGLVSAGADQSIRTWDVATARADRVIRTGIGLINDMALSPDGRRVAAVHYPSGTTKVWDLETGREVLDLGAGGFGHPTFSPDGERIVARSRGGITVRSAANGRKILEDLGSGTTAVFSPDGRRLASAGTEGTVALWDADSGREILTLHAPGGNLHRIAFSPDGHRIAAGGDDGTIFLWDATPGDEGARPDRWILLSQDRPIGALAFSPDGRQLAAGGAEDKTVRVWELASGREVRTLYGSEGRVSFVAYSPDGRQFASTGDERTVRLWDAVTGRHLANLEGLEDRGGRVVFSPDGRHLAVCEAYYIRIWDLTTRRMVGTDRGEAWVTDLASSLDGRYRAVSGSRSAVFIREGRDGHILRQLGGSVGFVWGVAFSPDGRHLASAGDDRLIRLWDVASWTEARTLRGHDTRIAAVAFSLDGRHLASSGYDGTVALWDLAGGRILRTLRGPLGESSIALSPDGRYLAASSSHRRQGQILVWDLTRLDLTADLRKQAAVAFDQGQRRRQSGLYAQAPRSYQQALGIRMQLAQANPDDIPLRRDLAVTYQVLAEAHTTAGRRYAALENARMALEVREHLVRDRPDDDRLRTELAEVYEAIAFIAPSQAGGTTETIHAHQRALVIREEGVREHPDACCYAGNRQEPRSQCCPRRRWLFRPRWRRLSCRCARASC
jgi:WD40 repeat protein